MLRPLLDLADRFVPDDLTGDERRMAQALARIALLVMPWSPLIGLFLAGLGAVIPGLATCAVAPLLGGVLWLSARSHTTAAAHALCAAILQCLVIDSVMLGGVGSPPTQWIVLLPVAATVTAGVAAGTLWTRIVMTSVFLLFLLQVAGGVDDPYLPPGWDVLGLITLLGLYLLMGQFLRANDETYRTLLGRTQAAELEAREANRAKSSFLASMSHELRTPLNAILGYTELVIEDLDGEPAADLGHVHTAGTHLLHLVNDLLDLSKIDAEKLELSLESVELHSLVEQIAREIDVLVVANDNTLELRLAPCSVLADRLRLKQVVLNLLSNAAKFTQKGSITVTVADGRLTVVDTGIGMCDEQQTRIFEPFAQATTATAAAYGGTGLGLAIARRLVTAMHGELTVESELGQGSTFQLTLPQSTGS